VGPALLESCNTGLIQFAVKTQGVPVQFQGVPVSGDCGRLKLFFMHPFRCRAKRSSSHHGGVGAESVEFPRLCFGRKSSVMRGEHSGFLMSE